MKKTQLVIMAAGIGSRYGAGVKQLAKVGPSGEIIIDYSIHDALKAGFDEIVFIIRKDIEADFREVIGDRIEKVAPVRYVFQDLHDLPRGFSCPEGRTKPWGTAQAIWSARHVVDSPFLVINADDFYGAGAFRVTHDYLVTGMDDDPDDFSYCMAGYILENTLSDHGSVSRGVCDEDDAGFLRSVRETYHIAKNEAGLVHGDYDGEEVILSPRALTSMNMWGLKPNIMDILDEGFPLFLKGVREGDLTAEYLLPRVVDELIKDGRVSVRVLPVEDVWYGVTYREDRQYVTEAVREMVDKGIYGERLFG